MPLLMQQRHSLLEQGRDARARKAAPTSELAASLQAPRGEPDELAHS